MKLQTGRRLGLADGFEVAIVTADFSRGPFFADRLKFVRQRLDPGVKIAQQTIHFAKLKLGEAEFHGLEDHFVADIPRILGGCVRGYCE